MLKLNLGLQIISQDLQNFSRPRALAKELVLFGTQCSLWEKKLAETM
jgi:hypothetical protein